MGNHNHLGPFDRLFDLNKDDKLEHEEKWLRHSAFFDLFGKKTDSSEDFDEDETEAETEEWECPVCGSTLTDQYGFDEEEVDWLCECCYTRLHRDFEGDPYEVSDDEEEYDEEEYDDEELDAGIEYPNKRMRQAAIQLDQLLDGRWLTLHREEEITRCQWILNSQDPAARYLTASGEFLMAQAVKENFNLPFAVPDEDEEVKTEIEDLIQKLAHQDAALAVDVWVWCVYMFSPHNRFMYYTRSLYNNLLWDLEDQPTAFLDGVIDRLEKDEVFRTALLTRNPETPEGVEQLIIRSLDTDRISAAKILFTAAAAHPECSGNRKELIESIVDACKDWETLEHMESLQRHLLPVFRSVEDPRVQRMLPKLEEDMAQYIYEIEQTEPYQYSRRYEWRSHCSDSREYGIDPLDYETQGEYEAALDETKRQRHRETAEEAKSNGPCMESHETKTGYQAAMQALDVQWRQEYAQIAKEYGLDLCTFETQKEFQTALHYVKHQWRRKYWEEARRYGLNVYQFGTEEQYRQAAAEKKRQEQEKKQAECLDRTVYRFCGVQFVDGGQIYHYRTDDESITVGDRVVVPVGARNETLTLEVVSVELHRRNTAPFPVERAKFILRKVDSDDNTQP